MNIFETAKAAISVKEAAAFYGIRVNSHNMCCCPFHNDKTPSMILDRKYFGRFHCFGCGASGDVIDFVSELFSISAKETAKKLCNDFGIVRPGQESLPVTKTHSLPKRNETTTASSEYRDAEQSLTTLLRNAYQNTVRFDPKTIDEPISDSFAKAMNDVQRYEYWFTVLEEGTDEERKKLYKDIKEKKENERIQH